MLWYLLYQLNITILYIQFAKVSIENFKEEQSIQLSSNFASFATPLSYPVKNDNDAIIGQIIGNGIIILTNGQFTHYNVCLSYSQDDNSFTTYDIFNSYLQAY